MNIDGAARATRAHKPVFLNGMWWVERLPLRTFPEEHGHHSEEEAQAACDRLNLLAVLEAIREPSENVARAARETADVESSYYESNVYNRWRAMIDELISEVRGQT